jgi:hypothetical protein
MLKRRAGKVHTSGELIEVEMAYLEDRPLPPDASFEDDSAYWSMDRDDGAQEAFRPGRPSVADMWQAMGADIVEEWLQERPGSRPAVWWRYDAPEPRRRLGGVGEPGWPDLHCGVPNHWAWPTSIAGGEFTGGPARCDPADPPVFESQAAYLQRHGLLHDGEAERLTDADFEPQSIRVPRRVYVQVVRRA